MKINVKKSYRRNFYNNLYKTKLKTIKVHLLVKPDKQIAKREETSFKNTAAVC
jgi:hypothetical protein